MTAIAPRRVSILIQDGVADIRLTRPEKMNALDADMFEQIIAAGERCAADTSIRAVVLSGDGRSFCAGLDVAGFSAMAGSKGAALDLVTRTHGDANIFQRAALVWRDLAIPVIAALHGAVFGGGLQIALGADIRIADPATRLSVMEIKWGLVPDMSGICLMRELARPDIVRELSWTGRIFDADQALQYGFVTRITDEPREAALAIAAQIAAHNPDAIRAIKRLLVLPADRKAILAAEAAEQALLMGSANQIEAVRAANAGEPPRFVS